MRHVRCDVWKSLLLFCSSRSGPSCSVNIDTLSMAKSEFGLIWSELIQSLSTYDALSSFSEQDGHENIVERVGLDETSGPLLLCLVRRYM